MKIKKKEFGYVVRYSNRKYYHVNTSSYVTLEEMEKFIGSLVVIDKPTGRNVTARTKLMIEFNRKMKELGDN